MTTPAQLAANRRQNTKRFQVSVSLSRDKDGDIEERLKTLPRGELSRIIREGVRGYKPA